MSLTRLFTKISSPIRFVIVFGINYVFVLFVEFFFVYTLAAPEIITDYGEDWMQPDFQSMDYFADKEVLDSTGIQNCYYVMCVNDGHRQIIRFDRSFIFGRLAVDEIVNVNTGDEISFRNFLGKDTLIIYDDYMNIHVTGVTWQSDLVVAKYVIIILLMTLFEYFLFTIPRRRM